MHPRHAINQSTTEAAVGQVESSRGRALRDELGPGHRLYTDQDQALTFSSQFTVCIRVPVYPNYYFVHNPND